MTRSRIFFLSLAFLSFGIWAYPFLSPDEPRYAETAREMLENSQFIVPYCDYLPRFDKPILFYWLEVLSFKIFGINEFAARFPSSLAGALIVSSAYALGSFYNYGFIAAMISMTSFALFVMSKMAITDMCLSALICLALTEFFLKYKQSKKFSLWIGFFTGLAVLCKGPVGIILPLLIIIIFLIKEKFSLGKKHLLQMLANIGIFLILVLPWYIAVDKATQGAFTQAFFLGHNFLRYTQIHTGHNGPWYFYILVIALGFLPWTLFVPNALKHSLHAAREDSQLQKFCIVWILSVFVFYTLSRTKLPTYILPVFLPLSLLMAKWWLETKLSSKLFLLVIASYLLISCTCLPYFFLKQDYGSKKFIQSLDPQTMIFTYRIHPTRFSFYHRSQVRKISNIQALQAQIHSPSTFSRCLIISARDLPSIQKIIQKDKIRILSERFWVYEF